MNPRRRPDLLARPNAWISAAIFVFVAALYIRTAAPTLGGGVDSEEYQQVAYTLGVAHSTGYPLYLILGKLFTTLVPVGNVAYRMNLLSALLGAGAAVVVYLVAFQLTQRRAASLATTALYATNEAVWRQSGVASANPLNLLLIGLVLYCLVLWSERRIPLSVAAFVFGLGLAHHRSILFLAPAIVIFVLLVDPRILRQPRQILKNALWLAVPSFLYLYIPIAGYNSPWYSNTWSGFIVEVFGNESGHFVSLTFSGLAGILSAIGMYLHDSFGYVGLGLIIVGAASMVPPYNRWATSLRKAPVSLFLGLGVLSFLVFAILIMGENDRYLVLPFFWLLFFFAAGIGAIEQLIQEWIRLPQARLGASMCIWAGLALFLAFPLGDRFRLVDWSSYNREYELWNEIFTLPIPRGATIVGDWGQLNAMRYMQRVENRRPDLQLVGTQYDPAPQTDAARAAFADGRAFYLSPGVALPRGSYRYALLGPLLEVRDAPQMQPPAAQKNIAMNSALALADFGISTALAPYAPETSIAPGRTVRVALDWHAVEPVKNFLVRLQLYDPTARLVAQKDEPPVRGLYPASEWQRGEYVSDVHNFLIPPGTPPGDYALWVQTLDVATKEPTSDLIALGAFGVTRVTNLPRDQVFVQHPLDVALNDRIDLWGVGGLDAARRAGETIGMSLLWHAREDVGTDFVARFALLDPSGKTVSEWERAPILFYPTREWRKGELLKAYYDLRLPDDLPQGEYAFTVGVEQHVATLGRVRIAP